MTKPQCDESVESLLLTPLECMIHLQYSTAPNGGRQPHGAKAFKRSSSSISENIIDLQPSDHKGNICVSRFLRGEPEMCQRSLQILFRLTLHQTCALEALACWFGCISLARTPVCVDAICTQGTPCGFRATSLVESQTRFASLLV
ncbi:uncharacterized protein V6R79_023211 [Siganus canaliculatus]